MSDFKIQKNLYNNLALPIAYGACSAAAPFHSKLRDTLRARKGVRSRWAETAKRFTERPVWFHVSSVGEYEQAKPVITALGERHPDVPVALSFTSPSGLCYAKRKEILDDDNNIKFIDYLPFDFADNARFCLTTLDPRLLVFVKFDLWPNLLWEAAARDVPSVLIDATLSASSYRFSGLGKRFYRAVYSQIEKILAISNSDADRFRTCVPDHSGILVAGDTRFDRVMERKRMNGRPSINIESNGRRVIIAGSTWPKDETHLLGALAELAHGQTDLMFIIAPHEPTAERVTDLMRWASSNRLSASTLSQCEQSTSSNGDGNVIVVDSVGVLAETYQYGDVAYIGGSFSSGVHSVIEPAIMGMPVLFGPLHKNSFEALELIDRQAAFEVTNQQEIYSRFQSILGDHGLRDSAGQRARHYVESQLGATERCMEAITEYL